MKTERDYFEEIERLQKKELIKEAENILQEFSNRVNNKPNYVGYFWRSKAYDCLNGKKYALNILTDIESATQFIEQLPQKELPIPALLLKAKAHFYLKKFELCITLCDEILKKKKDGEAFFIRAISKANIFNENENENIFNDLRKAAEFGHKKAADYLHNRNFKKKKDKR